MAKTVQRLIATEEKERIREKLMEYRDRFTSIDICANTLKQVSPTTIRNIIGQNYTNISDAMWRSVRSQIGGASKADWVYVNTTAVEDLKFIMGETKEEQGFTWAISPAGSGKTVAATLFMEEHKNVFHVQCDADMSKSDFAIELARAVGLRVNIQKKARRVIMEVCEYLAELEEPLVIFDEGDKLKEGVFAYFITIYNKIHKVAGVLFLSTSYAEKRIETGLKNNWPGYQEIWSRFGRKFYIVDSNTTNDVQYICIENGLSNEGDLKAVKNDAIAADLDLRRVEKKVIAIRKKNAS